MGDDSMRAKARATFGKEFMAAAAPQGYAKNAAVALQQRANARPIPTYKVGGVVKKDPYGGDRTPSTKIPAPRPSVEGPDIKAGQMKPRTVPGADKKLKAAQDRASALGLKKGGKVAKKAGGGLLEALGIRKKPTDNMEALKTALTSSGEAGMKGVREDMASAARESIGTQTAARAQPEIPTGGKQSFGSAFRAAREAGDKTFTFGGKSYTTKMAGEGMPTRKAIKAAAPAARSTEPAAPAVRPTVSVTAPRVAATATAPTAKRETGLDRLIARNVAQKQRGEAAAAAVRAERERSKAEVEMAETKRAGREAKRIGAGSYKPAGRFLVAPIKRAEGGSVSPERIAARAASGMKKGGKAKGKPGLAVMIAIGKTKPGKADGGAADYRAAPTATGVKMRKGGVQTSSDTARKLATEMGGMKCGGKPGKYAAGGAGKVRKGQAPIKLAKGGAGKVRKGMMTPSGDITKGVKPKKGIGGIM